MAGKEQPSEDVRNTNVREDAPSRNAGATGVWSFLSGLKRTEGGHEKRDESQKGKREGTTVGGAVVEDDERDRIIRGWDLADCGIGRCGGPG